MTTKLKADRLDSLSKEEAVAELRTALNDLEDSEEQASSAEHALEEAEAELEERDDLLIRVYCRLEDIEERRRLSETWADIKRKAADLVGIGNFIPEQEWDNV